MMKVIAAARELYTAHMILRGGDTTEDDHFHAVVAADALHDALRDLDSPNNQRSNPLAETKTEGETNEK